MWGGRSSREGVRAGGTRLNISALHEFPYHQAVGRVHLEDVSSLGQLRDINASVVLILNSPHEYSCNTYWRHQNCFPQNRQE